MLDAMRKMMASTLVVLSPSRAQALARSMVDGGGREQVSRAAEDLMRWSARNRERVVAIVRDEVRSQLRQLGVASRDEVEALRKRVRELEKTRVSPAKKTPGRASARRSSAKQPGAERDATTATTTA